MNTSKIKLSVVIPMYMGKDYIEDTIESILSLKCAKEIIIVDDGSPDDSYEYCENKWKSNDEIVLVRKDNSGIVGARNYGLKIASGKYLIFVDQDDLVLAETVEEAIRAAEKEAADMIVWSTARLLDSGEVVDCDKVYRHAVIEGDAVGEKLLKQMLMNVDNTDISYIGHVWAGLYRTSFVKENSIWFKRFVDYEDDYLFVFDCLKLAKKVCCISNTGYYWRYNKKSETYRLKYIPDILDKYRNLYVYLLAETRERMNEAEFSRYKLFIQQDVLIRATENCCSCINFSWEEIRTLHSHIQMNRDAFATESVQLYTKRRKRVFALISFGWPMLAYMYVFFDSLYRKIMLKK